MLTHRIILKWRVTLTLVAGRPCGPRRSGLYHDPGTAAEIRCNDYDGCDGQDDDGGRRLLVHPVTRCRRRRRRQPTKLLFRVRGENGDRGRRRRRTIIPLRFYRRTATPLYYNYYDSNTHTRRCHHRPSSSWPPVVMIVYG